MLCSLCVVVQPQVKSLVALVEKKQYTDALDFAENNKLVERCALLHKKGCFPDACFGITLRLVAGAQYQSKRETESFETYEKLLELDLPNDSYYDFCLDASKIISPHISYHKRRVQVLLKAIALDISISKKVSAYESLAVAYLEVMQLQKAVDAMSVAYEHCSGTERERFVRESYDVCRSLLANPRIARQIDKEKWRACSWCHESSKKEHRKLFPCSRCVAVYYCNETCQMADWKAHHKKYCVKKDW